MKIDLKLSREEFLKFHCEKRPLLVRNAISVRDFSWRNANEIFDRDDVLSEDFKLSCGGIVPKSEYVESYLDIGKLRHRLIKSAVYEYMRDGATLISNKIKGDPVVESLARQIGNFSGRQVVSSAYAAFGTRDSFRAHWDTRDVFAVQLIGRKRWVVYAPTFEDPLYMQQSKDYESEFPHSQDPCMDFVLEAGDVFYLPRGWWHNPLPLGEETFHLAFGTFPAFGLDYLTWAVAQSPHAVVARRSLDDWERSRDVVAAMSKHIAEFLCNRENYQRFQDEFLAATRFDSSLAIDIFGNANEKGLKDDQGVRICTTSLHGLDQGYLIANGLRVRLDEVGVNLMRHVASSPGISIAALQAFIPDAEPEKIRNLVTNLCRQDVLEPVFLCR